MSRIITALVSVILVCGLGAGTGMKAMADALLIDDFRGNAKAQWRFFADTVMGGVSSGEMRVETRDGHSHVRLTGKVSTENNGGFIQIRKKLQETPPAGIRGIRLIARGNGQRYFVHLRTRGTVLPWQYYQARFEVTGSFTEFRLPLTAFEPSGRMLARTPSPSSLTSVAIVAYGRDHEADVSVREIGFY